MSIHEQSFELAAVVAALQAEVKALRAESSAAKTVRRRSRLRVLVPILSLLVRYELEPSFDADHPRPNT